MKRLSFTVNPAENTIIEQIAERAHHEIYKGRFHQTRLDTIMDITACHANGNPLKLEELLKAPDFDFAHDVLGINHHINRATGELQNCFLPRYSK